MDQGDASFSVPRSQANAAFINELTGSGSRSSGNVPVFLDRPKLGRIQWGNLFKPPKLPLGCRAEVEAILRPMTVAKPTTTPFF